MIAPYETVEPKRADVDALSGTVLLEFGSPTCGWCRAAEPRILSAIAAHPEVRHIKVADASERKLGRSFEVKLWPTLVFLNNGAEVARLVRPDDATQIAEALARLD